MDKKNTQNTQNLQGAQNLKSAPNAQNLQATPSAQDALNKQTTSQTKTTPESKDSLKIGKYTFDSRFILGSGKYSLELIQAALQGAGAQIITLALRRADSGKIENILDFIPPNIALLPNTSGARNATEAFRIARLAREICKSDMIKIEVIRDSKYLLPDNYETAKAVEMLANEGFTPLPYMYPDLYAARDMRNAGAAAIMPLGAPIGSNRGLRTKDFIQILIDEIELPIIVDAGIGSPAQACEAMQMGASAIMANTAIANAKDIAKMARAFGLAIEAGRAAFLAGIGENVFGDGALGEGGLFGGSGAFGENLQASASSPLTGFLRD